MTRPPVVYRNSRAAAAFFLVPLDLAQDLLQDTALHAVGFGKFGVLNATWFDYAESSIGPYHEFSLGVVASTERQRLQQAASLLRGKARLGSFVLALPVDSEVARAGGLEHFGLPKTLAEFRLNWSRSRLTAALAQDGNTIVSMDLPLGLGLPVQVRDLVVFSKRAGRLVTTTIPTQWPVKLDPVGRPRLKIHTRHHPLGQLMTRLDLENARTLFVVHGPLEHAQLPLPDHGAEPTQAHLAPRTLDRRASATTTSPASDDCEAAGSPPTPRSGEASFRPIPVKPKTLPPQEPAALARCDEDAKLCGPESVVPVTVRSRTE